ncbi:cytosolic phospholipase A2 gamma [Danio aesculapii]|uniref:cytosolic phospholipase A2 gamma n=1 Tax=Danio aesculapii TaxID=1142201 RepID=UPI0024BFAE3D|nr:cytosolic phospholipase A2 gamma [Danio aesculapii]
MSASKCRKSGEVRIEPSLNKSEQEFVAKRRISVLQSLQKLPTQCNQDNVPNIALLGSGGGQRAMVGLLGSLDQLDKAGLLDCVLYLSGVSGSTWCMASLYQEPDWSTKLQAVKERIVRRISGDPVSWSDKFAKLKKYFKGKDHFSLTDVWAVLAVTTFVKEIDEHTLTDQQGHNNRNPFPIYTVIDKTCKQRSNGDPWFEITPYEAGYSLSGAFVNASIFGSQFHEGSRKNQQNVFDMLYLQALCGSALADELEIMKLLWQKIKELFQQKDKVLEEYKKDQQEKSQEAKGRERESALGLNLQGGFKVKLPEINVFPFKDPNPASVDKCYQMLMNLVDMNLAVLNGKDPSALDESIRAKLNDISGGQSQRILDKLRPADKTLCMKNYTKELCNYLTDQINLWPFDAWMYICTCMYLWIWGRNYNFLHDITDEAVPSTLPKGDTRDYIDAGLLLNSPYFSVLRKERNVNLIISLDFSEGDPFLTVKDAAEMCRKQNIPFPQVNIPDQDIEKPKDFYVFKGQNTPTVIHIPLFNVVNCGDKLEDWRKKYRTFQGAYSAEMITDLMNVAGKNISNCKEKLMMEISAAIGQKACSC